MRGLADAASLVALAAVLGLGCDGESRTDGGLDRFLFPERDVVVLQIHNTSTERLAEYLASRIIDVLRADGVADKLTRFEIEVEEAGGQCGLCVLDPI